MGLADPSGNMDENLKSENMQKRAYICYIFAYICYILRAIGAGRCRQLRYADDIFIQIQAYFRMHHFVVKFSKFSSPQAARGIPLTKILRTFLCIAVLCAADVDGPGLQSRRRCEPSITVPARASPNLVQISPYSVRTHAAPPLAARTSDLFTKLRRRRRRRSFTNTLPPPSSPSSLGSRRVIDACRFAWRPQVGPPYRAFIIRSLARSHYRSGTLRVALLFSALRRFGVVRATGRN